jgi:hypothetical protein
VHGVVAAGPLAVLQRLLIRGAGEIGVRLGLGLGLELGLERRRWFLRKFWLGLRLWLGLGLRFRMCISLLVGGLGGVGGTLDVLRDADVGVGWNLLVGVERLQSFGG